MVVRSRLEDEGRAINVEHWVTLLPHCQQGYWLASKQVASASKARNALFFWTLRELANRANLASNNLNSGEQR